MGHFRAEVDLGLTVPCLGSINKCSSLSNLVDASNSFLLSYLAVGSWPKTNTSSYKSFSIRFSIYFPPLTIIKKDYIYSPPTSHLRCKGNQGGGWRVLHPLSFKYVFWVFSYGLGIFKGVLGSILRVLSPPPFLT